MDSPWTKSTSGWFLHGRVFNVPIFLSQHLGGEWAILTPAGKDATAEFDMIHPPDVVIKYVPDAVIGTLGDGGEMTMKRMIPQRERTPWKTWQAQQEK